MCMWGMLLVFNNFLNDDLVLEKDKIILNVKYIFISDFQKHKL